MKVLKTTWPLHLILFSAIVLRSFEVSAQSRLGSLPRFETFPVDSSDIIRGRSVKIKFLFHYSNGAKESSVRERRQANFAGHEIVDVSGDCGTGCIEASIYDAMTRSRYDIPFTIENCCGKEDFDNPVFKGTEPRIECRLGSDLLIIRGARNEHGWGTYYYVWKGDHLQLLRSVKGRIIKSSRAHNSTKF